jgi:hypothetical protein
MIGGRHFGFHFSYRANDGEPFTFDFDSDSEAFRAAAAEALGLSQDTAAWPPVKRWRSGGGQNVRRKTCTR